MEAIKITTQLTGGAYAESGAAFYYVILTILPRVEKRYDDYNDK